MSLSIFKYEFKHFFKSKAKLFSYLLFMLLCVFSIYNGFEIMQKQIETIEEINTKKETETFRLIEWLERNKKGPAEKPWVNIEDPYWSIRYTPCYVFKTPSALFPLGIGQSEQYGFYKKVTRWSSTYDSDMVEEISNYERLIHGNIDFSFLIIFLLPILIIILTYNINGLEKDLKFHKLISVQNRKINYWLFNRLLFYLFLILLSVDALILSVGLFNDILYSFDSVLKIIFLSNLYILFFSVIFYFLNKHATSSKSVAFKMISVWLIFCVVIPGSVHQYASFKYPTNYMTDFLDVNRKQTYEVFKLDDLDLYDVLIEMHPELMETQKAEDTILDSQLIRRSLSTIINQMNISAANQIEIQNERKNKLIRTSYFFNPVSFVQNLWSSYTATDYSAYADFRLKIQNSISSRNKLIVLELWKEKSVDKETYLEYLKILNNL